MVRYRSHCRRYSVTVRCRRLQPDVPDSIRATVLQVLQQSILITTHVLFETVSAILSVASERYLRGVLGPVSLRQDKRGTGQGGSGFLPLLGQSEVAPVQDQAASLRDRSKESRNEDS